MDEPSPEPGEQRDDPNADHLDVTAQYGGGKDWETEASGLRRLWKRLRGT